MREIKLRYGHRLKEMIDNKKISLVGVSQESINELLSCKKPDNKKFKVPPKFDSSVFVKCLKESREKSFVEIDKKFEKLNKENTFIGCDTALKGKDRTIITLLTPSNPTKDSWFDKIRDSQENVPIACWIDESEDTVLEKAEKIIELFGIIPVPKETLKRLSNAGIKDAEAGKRFREAIINIKAKEVSKEDKKPIKQPCNPASRKFNKEFWR